MSEIAKWEPAPKEPQAQDKPDVNALVTKALGDKVLSEAEGQEILNRLVAKKKEITTETKNKLAAFLAEGDNGRNWNGSLGKELEKASVADEVKKPADKEGSQTPVENKKDGEKKAEAPEKTDPSFVEKTYDSVAQGLSDGYDSVKTAIAGTETPEESAFMEWLSDIKMHWVESFINDQVDNSLKQNKALNENQKAELLSLKKDASSNVFGDFTSDVKLEKRDKAHVLSFKIDPMGLDGYNHDTSYVAELTSLKPAENTKIIEAAIKEAYAKQIAEKASSFTKATKQA